MTSYTTFEELKQGTNEVTRTVLVGDLDVDEEEVEPVGVGADDTALGGIGIPAAAAAGLVAEFES